MCVSTVFTVVNPCVCILSSWIKPRNRNTTLYHYIALLFSVLLHWYVKMKPCMWYAYYMTKTCGIFLVKLSTETPCCSKRNHQKPSLKIKKKNNFTVGPNFRVWRVTPNQLFFIRPYLFQFCFATWLSPYGTNYLFLPNMYVLPLSFHQRERAGCFMLICSYRGMLRPSSSSELSNDNDDVHYIWIVKTYHWFIIQNQLIPMMHQHQHFCRPK